jgi:threonine/homoserine/homoserine lactone efflux protein
MLVLIFLLVLLALAGVLGAVLKVLALVVLAGIAGVALLAWFGWRSVRRNLDATVQRNLGSTTITIGRARRDAPRIDGPSPTRDDRY